MSLITLLDTADSAAGLLGWSRRIAAVHGLERLVFCLLPEAEGDRIVRLRAEDLADDPLVEAVREVEFEESVRIYLLRQAEPVDVLEQLVEREASWIVSGVLDDALVRGLFESKAFHVMLLAAEAAPVGAVGVAVPGLGGPHPKHAVDLAGELCVEDVSVLALDEAVEGQGNARRLAEGRRAEVVQAPGEKLSEAIAGVADADELDLVIAGLDDPVRARRLVSGWSGGGEGRVAIAALRGPGAAKERTQELFIGGLRQVVPRLERDHRKQLDESVAERSRLQLDFVVLIVFSTAIAGLGLIKDSGAVVIGAMLVAPLMTPMIGAGLALVQGNTVLAKRAIGAVIVGFCISLAVSLLLGVIVQPGKATHEMLLRGENHPDLADFAIALLSGFAAAWASARPGLTGALAGVAIAAALVPPIATVGLSTQAALAGAYPGAWNHAGHAAVLFAVNLVAIIFASALALLVLGMRPSGRDNRVPDWQSWGFAAAVVLVSIVAIVIG